MVYVDGRRGYQNAPATMQRPGACPSLIGAMRAMLNIPQSPTKVQRIKAADALDGLLDLAIDRIFRAVGRGDVAGAVEYERQARLIAFAAVLADRAVRA